MPATDARAQFIRQPFRSVTNGPKAAIVAAYGDLAKRTTEAIPTFFEAEGDAQAMCDARMDLLAQHNRLHKNTVTGIETGIALDYVTGFPTAQVIDDEGDLNQEALISEIVIDFENEVTNLETWGQA